MAYKSEVTPSVEAQLLVLHERVPRPLAPSPQLFANIFEACPGPWNCRFNGMRLVVAPARGEDSKVYIGLRFCFAQVRLTLGAAEADLQFGSPVTMLYTAGSEKDAAHVTLGYINIGACSCCVLSRGARCPNIVRCISLAQQKAAELVFASTTLNPDDKFLECTVFGAKVLSSGSAERVILPIRTAEQAGVSWITDIRRCVADVFRGSGALQRSTLCHISLDEWASNSIMMPQCIIAE